MSETDGNDIDKLFQIMVRHDASDLHLKVGSPPLLRLAGQVRELDSPPLKGAEVRHLLYQIINEDQIKKFEAIGDIDFAYGVPGVGRFRINSFRQRGSISIACRKVNVTIPSFEELNLPLAPFKKITKMHAGLVIVAGVTGSGKSTTLASIIDYINARRRCHIITIEDPIEYLYSDKKAFINQREVGIDVSAFKDALRYIVRQDPDVILIGEMRDKESFQTALTAAETGHLVFCTLHSSTVPQTLGRILDLFLPEQHEAIRKLLMFNLKAIICQKLLPSIKEGVGRVPNTEIMMSNPTIAKLIVEGRDTEIGDLIRGMGDEENHDFNQSLVNLINGGLISKRVGLGISNNPEQLEMNLRGIKLGDDKRILGKK